MPTNTSPDHGVTNQNVMRHHKLGGLSNHTNFSALCEFVDNSFDAHAQNIRIELREGLNDKGTNIEAQEICKNQKNTALESDYINMGISRQHHNNTDNTENPENSVNAGNSEGNTILRENYRMKTSKDNALYKLKSPALFIQDDGTGLASISQLLDVASNVQHSSRDQDIRKGIYGMGAKDAIARLGEYSLILSRMQPRDSENRDKEEISGAYSYLLAIYPFDDPEENGNNQSSNKLTTNKYAHCTLQVQFKKNPAGKALFTRINREITNNPSFQKMMAFMKKRSPFDFGENVNSLEAFYQILENLLNQMSVDFKPRKNVRINSETQGTLIMVWGIHQKPSEISRNKRKSTAQNSHLSYHKSDNNRSGSPTTFLEPFITNIFEQTVNLDTDDYHKVSLIDHLSEYFAYVETRRIKSKNQKHQRSHAKTQMPCIFVQGIRVHPKVFRTLLKKETILMKNVIFQGALDTVTFEIGELKSTCLQTGGTSGVGQGINYYWKNRFIKRVPVKNFGDHAIFVDLNKVAAPTQYKNDFRTDLVLSKKLKSKEGLWKFSNLETKLKREGRKHSESVELMKKFKYWNFNDSEYADESVKDAEFTGSCFVQCLTCGKIREIVNSVKMLNAYGIDENPKVFPRPDTTATKHCGFSCDDMHLMAHGRALEEGKRWCQFKQNCEIEGLLKGPIGLDCIEVGEYTQNMEAKSTKLILKNSKNFEKMFDLAKKENERQFDIGKQKDQENRAERNRLERDKILRQKTAETKENMEKHEKLLKDLNLSHIPVTESPKVSKPGKSNDIICLDSDHSEYAGPVLNIKCEKLNDTFPIPQQENFGDIPPTPPQTRNHNSNESADNESIDVPLSPTAVGTTDNDFTKKYGKTFELKKICDSNDSNQLKPKVAIIIRTAKKNSTSEFNFDPYFSSDGDNIWKGLRPLEIHRKSLDQAPVGSNKGEIQVKCHNGVGYECIAVDEMEEKYFNFDKGVIKLGFIQTRIEFCESVLLRDGDNPPRKWGVGSDKTQAYMVFSYESCLVEKCEIDDPHEMYDYIDEDLALNEGVIEKLVKFFDYMPKRDDLPQRGLDFGLDEGADIGHIIGKDYLDTRKEMQNPYETVVRTAHSSAKCNEWLHKQDLEATPSSSINLPLTIKNNQKINTNTVKNAERGKNAKNGKKRTLITGAWSKAGNSKATTSKRAKTSFLSEDEEENIENEENTHENNIENLDADEIEIDSDEHQEILEKKAAEIKTMSNQYVKNLQRKGFDELNTGFKLDMLGDLLGPILELIEVGVEDEPVESGAKRKIDEIRRIFEIELEIPKKAGRKRRK